MDYQCNSQSKIKLVKDILNIRSSRRFSPSTHSIEIFQYQDFSKNMDNPTIIVTIWTKILCHCLNSALYHDTGQPEERINRQIGCKCFKHSRSISTCKFNFNYRTLTIFIDVLAFSIVTTAIFNFQ